MTHIQAAISTWLMNKPYRALDIPQTYYGRDAAQIVGNDSVDEHAKHGHELNSEQAMHRAFHQHRNQSCYKLISFLISKF